MKKPKLTPWFPGSVKPVHVGEYQVREGSQLNWYWNGSAWRTPQNSTVQFECVKQNWTWRGLTSKAAA